MKLIEQVRIVAISGDKITVSREPVEHDVDPDDMLWLAVDFDAGTMDVIHQGERWS